MTINRRVVCAAIRNADGRIITGARHFDGIMYTQINFSKDDWSESEQGFIDQRGVFMTRQEAHEVATKESQIIRKVGGDSSKLFSENIY